MNDILIGGIYRYALCSFALEVTEKVSEDTFMVRIHWDGRVDDVFQAEYLMHRAALNIYSLDEDIKREKEFAKDMEELINDSV